jgi:translation initiation factor IF-2
VHPPHIPSDPLSFLLFLFFLLVLQAAMGVKISAQGLETAIAGSTLLVCKKGDDIEDLKDEVQGDLATILSKVDKSGQGVAVQASTLGSLEALLSFMADMKIPVSSISIGPVFKKDVMKAAVMLEKKPEYGVMLSVNTFIFSHTRALAGRGALLHRRRIMSAHLTVVHLSIVCVRSCFDVKVSPDAAKLADEMGVKVSTNERTLAFPFFFFLSSLFAHLLLIDDIYIRLSRLPAAFVRVRCGAVRRQTNISHKA